MKQEKYKSIIILYLPDYLWKKRYGIPPETLIIRRFLDLSARGGPTKDSVREDNIITPVCTEGVSNSHLHFFIFSWIEWGSLDHSERGGPLENQPLMICFTGGFFFSARIVPGFLPFEWKQRLYMWKSGIAGSRFDDKNMFIVICV